MTKVLGKEGPKMLGKEMRDLIDIEAEEGYNENQPKRYTDCQGSELVTNESNRGASWVGVDVQRRPKACLNGQFTSPVSALCGKASIWIAKTLDIKDSGSWCVLLVLNVIVTPKTVLTKKTVTKVKTNVICNMDL